jgi:RHS repeat-associated protein
MSEHHSARRAIAVLAAAIAALAGAAACTGGANGNDDSTPRQSSVGCDDLGLLPCARQVASASLPIAGSNIRLVYASDRAPGRRVDPAPPAAAVGLDGWSLSVLDALDVSSRTELTASGELRHVTPVELDGNSGAWAVAARDGATVTSFDQTGRPTAVHDALTGEPVLQFKWGADGLESVADRTGTTLTVRRDAAGTALRLDTASGVQTRLGVVDDRLAAVGYPDGSRAVITTADTGLLASLADPTGVVTQYQYDKDGRLTTRTDGVGTAVRFERHVVGSTTTVTAKLSDGTSVRDSVEELDDGTVRRTHVAADGRTTALEAAGMTRRLTTPGKRAVVIELAADPRWGMDAPVTASVSSGAASVEESRTGSAQALTRPPVTKIGVDGATWSYAYDPTERATTTTDPSGRTERVSFDNSGRVLSRQRAGAPQTTYHYADSGRIDRITLGTGAEARTWQYRYSPGHAMVIDPLGRRQVTVLGPDGVPTSITGPGSIDTALTTDAMRRLSGFAGPDGNQYRITRRADGKVAAISAPAGEGGPQFSTYAYDVTGHLTQISWPGGNKIITRDPSGRVTGFNAGSGPWTANYDDQGLLSAWSGPGIKSTTGYQAGQVVSEQVEGPFDVTVSRKLDGLGRTASETVGSAPAATYRYDKSGLLVQAGDLTIERDPATGAVTTERLGQLVRTWDHNQFGEVVSEKVTGEDGAVLADLHWQRDQLGRVLSESVAVTGQPDTTTRYAYDSTGRIAEVSQGDARTDYRYDPSGNLIRVTAPDGTVTTAEYDGRNALVQRGGVRYTYDGAGRLASAESSRGTTSYHYDGNGSLMSVEPPSGPTIEYVTDAYGRRIARKIDGQIMSGTIYRDQYRPAAEVDANGEVTARYVYSDSLSPAYVAKNGTDYLEVVDAVGSPTVVLDSTDGTVADTVTRDVWGGVQRESAPGFQLVGYAGGVTDPDTGLVRFGARDYAPETGRWTAPDPLGVAGGSPNLYSYVSADPVNRRDPTGLCDYFAVGISGGLALGSFGGRGEIGLATAGTQLGAYYGASGGFGAEGHLTVDIKCGFRFEQKDNAAPKLDDFGGNSDSVELGVGGGGGGLEWDDTTGTGVVNIGPAAGWGYNKQTGDHWCWFGCGPEPEEPHEDNSIPENYTDCGGMDAGICDPVPTDPRIGLKDDPNSPTNMCSGAGTCNDPGAGGVPAGGPASNGDPHLHTGDGAYYDLQAVGEFVALATDDGSLEVQTRQQPVPDSRTIAVNTAVAIQAVGNRVEVRPVAGSSEVTVELAGRPVGVGSRTLANGATLQVGTDSVAVRLAGGTGVGVRSNPLGLDLTFALDDSLKNHVHGLLGPFTGTPGNTVQSRSGAEYQVRELQDYDTRYHKFADSWRVSNASSLFDYGPGESTQTFTDPSFPDRNPPALPAAAERAATALCSSLGLPAGAVDGCVLDVASTGDAGFAATTATATASAAVIGPRTTSRISVCDTVSGRIAVPGAKSVYRLELAKGTVVYLRGGAASCDTVAWSVVGPAGSHVNYGSGICGDLGRTVADVAGTYTITVAGSGDGTGDYQFEVVRSAPDRTAAVSVGDHVSGQVPVPGAKLFYRLQLAKGTVVYLRGGTASCDTVAWSVVGPAGSHVNYGSGICGDLGRTVADVAGTYTITVGGSGDGTGAFAFTVERP